jgi:hypothetical protein
MTAKRIDHALCMERGEHTACLNQHTQQLALIDEAYYALPDMQDGRKDVPELLFEMNVEGERRHRKGTPGGYPGLSVAAAARYFTVKQLLDGWREPNQYTVDDIVNVRNEVLYAQAYAKRFRKELNAWALKYNEGIEQMDYAKLVK